MSKRKDPYWQAGATSEHFDISQQQWTDVKDAAIGRWTSTLEQLGISSEYLKGKHTSCPACGGKDRFRFDDRDGRGTFICTHCGAGDGWKLLQIIYGWRFIECIWRVQGVLGGAAALPVVSSPIRPFSTPEKPNLVAQKNIDRIFAESVKATNNNPVGRYLIKTRGFTLDTIPSDLRFHASCATKLDDGSLHTGPAMIAAVRNLSGDLMQIHRTFLTDEGQKAPIPKPKKLMASPYPGICNGCSVQLFPATTMLGVAEGIETAIAAHLRFGMPVWAALNTWLLTEIQIPDSVSEVVIFADNDRQKTDAGYLAARRLARKLTLRMKKVRIIEPNVSGSDFADLV